MEGHVLTRQQFCYKTRSSFHQIMVRTKWKCATGWQCFAMFPPAHWWHEASVLITSLTNWLWIFSFPGWTALFILLFQPLAYYFIWIKSWIFTALRVFLIFPQSEAKLCSKGQPLPHTWVSLPKYCRNPEDAKISKPWCAMVFKEIMSLIITFPPFPLFFWGKLNKRTQAWSIKRRSWRVTFPRCRMKWRNQSRSAGTQRKKPKKQSQM